MRYLIEAVTSLQPESDKLRLGRFAHPTDVLQDMTKLETLHTHLAITDLELGEAYAVELFTRRPLSDAKNAASLRAALCARRGAKNEAPGLRRFVLFASTGWGDLLMNGLVGSWSSVEGVLYTLRRFAQDPETNLTDIPGLHCKPLLYRATHLVLLDVQQGRIQTVAFQTDRYGREHLINPDYESLHKFDEYSKPYPNPKERHA